MARKKKSTAPAEVTLFTLNLTAEELTHIRDLFGVFLPTESTTSISEELAAMNNRGPLEVRLWDKIEVLCEEANVATGDGAPDFVIAPSAPPQLSIFPLSPVAGGDDEPEEKEDDDSEPSNADQK